MLRGFTVAVFSPTLSILIWMISMCLACFLCVRVSEFTSHIFVQPFYLFIFILWLWKHARSLLCSMFSVGGCVFCALVLDGLCLCSSQQEVQVDTVTVPRRATVGPCHPTTEALSLCSSWLVTDFLLSLFLSLSLPFLLSPFSCLKS